MTIPWRSLAAKLGGWLLDRGKEEAVKEIERRLHPQTTVIVQTVHPDSGAVVKEVVYRLDKSGALRPTLAPPSRTPQNLG